MKIIDTIIELNNLNSGDPAEAVMRIITLPTDIILALGLIIYSHNKADTEEA